MWTITPALGMLRNLRAVKPDKKVGLLWGINNRSDLICGNEFKEMEVEMNINYLKYSLYSIVL